MVSFLFHLTLNFKETMDKILEFKSDGLDAELIKVDSRLLTILYALVGYVYHNFGKSILITEILRTQAMQDEYYKDNPDYKIKKWYSVHQFGRGIDFSIRFFTAFEVAQIEEFLNRFVYGNGKKTCLIHDIGQGNHGHIQVNGEDKIELLKANI